MSRRTDRPVVITSAERSQQEQLRIRELRYVAMMLIRVACLIAAAVLFATKPPLWGLWLSLCAVGMTIIPWVAVVLANDRLPKEQHRWRRHRRGGAVSRGLASGTPSEGTRPQLAQQPPGPVIDGPDA